MARYRPPHGYTGIFSAIIKGDIEAVRECMDDPNVTNNDGMTALMLAARNGRTDILLFLLQEGADPNIPYKPSHNTALHYASENNQFECVHLLIQYQANVNANNIHLQTPLHRAASQASEKSLTFLLNAGANITSKDSLHRTPLDLAKAQEVKMRRSIAHNKPFDLVIHALEKAQEQHAQQIHMRIVEKRTKENLTRLRERAKKKPPRKPWGLR